MMELEESGRLQTIALTEAQAFVDSVRVKFPYVRITRVKIRGFWHKVHNGRIFKLPEGMVQEYGMQALLHYMDSIGVF